MKNDMLASVAVIESHTAALRAEILMLPDEVVVEVTPEPTPITPTVDPRAPSLKIRDVPLTDTQKLWLGRLKACKVYAPGGTREEYDLDALGKSGRLNDMSRHANLQLEQVISAFRVTGDGALVRRVYEVMQFARATLKANTGDGFRGWLYYNPNDLKLHNKDTTTMEEIMAHSMVALAARLFDVNRDVPEYAEAADFWIDYLVNEFEAKWRKRSNKPTGFPFIEKDLFHPFTNSVQLMHYLGDLTGEAKYHTERDRLIRVVRKELMVKGSSYVWPHIVNSYRAVGNYGWIFQKCSYSGETLNAVADLGLEGVLTEEDMQRFANTVTDNMLDGKAVGLLSSNCSGDTGGDLYYPLLGKVTHFNPPAEPRGTGWEWKTRGYALLARWDETGEIVNVSERLHDGDFIAPAVSVILGASR